MVYIGTCLKARNTPLNSSIPAFNAGQCEGVLVVVRATLSVGFQNPHLLLVASPHI